MKSQNVSGVGQVVCFVVALAVAFAGFTLSAAPGEVTLASGGRGATVVSADWPKPAAELAKYLEKVTGAKFAVAKDAAAVRGAKILLKKGMAGNHPNEFFREQSYALSTAGDTLTVVAPSEEVAYWAVYGFLEDHVGCHFYSPQFEFIPKKPTLKVALATVHTPSFQMRGYVYNPFQNYDWNRKNRVGGRPLQKLCSTHSFHQWIKADKNWPKHPEWFSMDRNGKREKNWCYGICGTNPALAHELAQNMVEWYRQNNPKDEPAKRYLPIGQGDGFSPCYCDQCRALVKREGTEAAPQILLFNRALEEAVKTYPNLSVCTFGYFQTLMPPKTLKPHPNIYIMLVSSSLSLNQAGDQFNGVEESAANRHFAKALKEWGARLPGHIAVYPWDGVDQGNSEYSEWPNVLSHARDIKYWHACGVCSAQKAGSPRPNWGDLTAWLWFRLMWDVTLDENALVREYLRDNYGERAAKILWEYFQYMEKVRKEAGYGCPTVRWSSWAPILLDKVFSPSVRETMNDYIDRAIAAAETPEYRKRLALVKATTVDQLFINASSTEPLGLVKDPETGRPWVVHGTDARLPGRIRRLVDFAMSPAGGCYDPRCRRFIVAQNAGSEAAVLKDGALEAVAAPWLRGQVVSLKRDGVEIFAKDGSNAGCLANSIGRFRPTELLGAAKPNAATIRTVIAPIEWMAGVGCHLYDATYALEGGKLRVTRTYSQPKDLSAGVPPLWNQERFNMRWLLVLANPEEAGVGIVGGGLKTALSLAAPLEGGATGLATKRAAERLKADCQNPMFDELAPVNAAGGKRFAFTSKEGDVTLSFARGDGLAVEIVTPAAGWDAVAVRPDAKKGLLEIEFVSSVFDGPKHKLKGEWALPAQTLAVKGAVTRKVAAKPAAAEPAPKAKIRLTGKDTAVNLADGAELIRIPAGVYAHGSKGAAHDELPARKIELSEYWIYKYPVTLAQYERYFADAKKGKFEPCWGQGQTLDPKVKAADYPVLCSWYEAEAYAKHSGALLPTEAQWEKAARGDGDARQYPWGDEWDGAKAVGWEMTVEQFREGMFPSSHCPQGASPYGVMDMSGNNFEWVRDWYDHDAWRNGPAKDPEGPAKGVNKIMKGGDSNFDETYARIDYRQPAPPERRDCVKVGFRCVVADPEIVK